MPDGNGHLLRAGDPVAYERREGDLAATVLAVRTEHTYLIQVDPVQPRSAHEHPRLTVALDAEATLLMQLAANPADVQEPFEVEGSSLYLLESEQG